eukprot:TRINITY_DN25948_c0_g1_i1.p3 TRINITY_DN25948_c0_g1~~TRINITY_DN25948_c0_g1_i1.p3  ORF type:complete len:112 (+),score=3.80 TRINITY_DN25948_c0_g1_i1:74-409(+)
MMHATKTPRKQKLFTTNYPQQQKYYYRIQIQKLKFGPNISRHEYEKKKIYTQNSANLILTYLQFKKLIVKHQKYSTYHTNKTKSFLIPQIKKKNPKKLSLFQIFNIQLKVS